MVIKIDDMESHWRRKWNSRSSQLGWTRWLTVSEYYSTFCYWKDNMVSHGCPAEEGNYIDAFIGNLREDIRLRLSKSRHRRNWCRLNDVFCAAKFEESMMLMEASIQAFELQTITRCQMLESAFGFTLQEEEWERIMVLNSNASAVSVHRHTSVTPAIPAIVSTEQLSFSSAGDYLSASTTGATENPIDEETENGACEELAEMCHSRIESPMKQTQASRNEGEATTKQVLGDQGVSENGAYKVLDEMFHPNSLNIAETQATNKDISRGEQHFEGVSPIDSLPRVISSNRGARFDEYEENSGLFLFDPGGKSVKHLGKGIVQSFTSQIEHQGEVNFVLTKDGTVRQRNDEAVQSHLLKLSSLTKLTAREIYAQGIDGGYKQYQFYLVNPYSCSSKIMMQLANRECENSTPFIGKEVIFSFDPGGSSCLLGAWNWNDLETFAIKADQYNEVGDLSYTCVDILEFGGSCEDSFTIAAAQIGTENTVTGNFILSFKNISNDLNNHLKQVWPFLFFYKGFHEYMFTPLLLLIFCIWAFPMAVIVCKDLNISSIRPKELNENVDDVVIPVVQVNAIWGDESEFADIFDLDYFKKVLANDVRILSLLPSTCLRALDHFHEARFLSGQNVVLIMDTTLENFVWHPGLCAFFLLILEVKDVFKGVGKRIVSMDTILVIMGYENEIQMECLDCTDDIRMIWCLNSASHISIAGLYIEKLQA